jgi:hypothetical protein
MNNGTSPQLADLSLRNSQTSQTGTFGKLAAAIIDCQQLLANLVECTNVIFNSLTVLGHITASDYYPTGLPGATNMSRYVGGTVSGPPIEGTFRVGDYILASDGHLWICVVSGEPGTWVEGGTGAFLPLAGGTMSGTIDMNGNPLTNALFLSVFGVSGATTITRYVGGTVSGPPVSGSYQVGDYIVSQDGNVYIYKTGGTWSESESGTFLPLAGGTMSGTINMNGNEIKGALDLAVHGVSGATDASRYVGGTISGAPMSGTYSVGDYVVSYDGSIYIYKTGGTWNQSGSGTFLPLAGGVMSGTIDMNTTNEIKGVLDLAVHGVPGATDASRYVGGTTSGAPMTGTYSVGDYIVSRDGNIYIYKTGGTWNQHGSGSFLPLAGGTMSGTINMNTNNEVKGVLDLVVTGVSGATDASRYVGGTVSGAPMTGTYSVGDYIVSNDGSIYIYKTGGTWNQNGGGGAFLPLAGGTMSGTIDMASNEIKGALDVAVTGITGATSSSRYVGGTVSGAPMTGTYSVGDYIVSQEGNIYIYKTGGSWIPGTFLQLAGGTMSGAINMNGNEVKGVSSFAVSGVSGATTASRYVGGKTTGQPTTGTFNTGDYVVSQDGNVHVCTTGGISGSWNPVGQKTLVVSASGTTNIPGGVGNVLVNTTGSSQTLALPDLTSSIAPSYNITVRVNIPIFVTSSAPTAIRVTTNHIYIGLTSTTTLFNGVVRSCILRLVKPALTVDTTWNMNCNGSVFAFWDDGTYLYVGGGFSQVNGGTARNNLCRVLLSSTTGTVDATWNMNVQSTIVTTLWGDGTNLYVGGGFTTVNGATTRNNICRCLLSSTTGTVDSWDMNCAAQVNSIWGDSTNVYVCGSFTTVNGATTRNRICRAPLSSTTGTVDATWNLNSNFVTAVVWGDSTNLYVGGLFTSVNGGTSRNGVCRCLLSSTTGTVDSWNLNITGSVFDIIGDGTNVYFGGSITAVSSSPALPRVALASVLASSSTGAPTTFVPPNLGGTSMNNNCLDYDSSSGLLHVGFSTGGPSYIPMAVKVTITSFNGTDTLNQRSNLFPYVNLVSSLQNPTFNYSSSTNWESNNIVQSFQ